MANQVQEYKIRLGLETDIKSAQQNLLNFQQSLNKISSMNVGDLGLSKQLNEASQAAQSLQTHLNNAFDVKTGNLDLGKFQASLQKSNQTVAQLGQNLLKAGPAGEQAFLQMTRALQNANIKMLETESRLGKLLTTFKNTLRWQISASALNALTGAFQSALNYSQDLNKSLNDIRIVTGYSSDKMAQFAKQANKAAEALNTSTLKYTDASLIYFQQGLGDKEVEERTNTTIKLMNVTGENAETTSDWMTSIWNNFYDGSKSLEYYADVLAKLGATTASSADEIATGLEKFAAIGDTVGLSYEYAASALATVTATTRQSAEVVGTAFKTLFARIQNLKLGETLEDGTTLSQYSEALYKVGINIKDGNGGLKEMDTILDEIGAKWDLLSKDTQVALAQSVAGIRQYTQFIALMDNWDFFEENVKNAQEAGGSLEEQAQIYADSWEAAQADVQNSLEKLWSSLVPEDQLIDLYHSFAEILDVVDLLTNALGGFEGIILLVSSLLINKFQANLTNAINSGIQSLVGLKTRFMDTFAGFTTGGGINPFKKGQQTERAQYATERNMIGTTKAQIDQTTSIEKALNTSGISEGFKMQLQELQEINKYQNLIANSGRLMTSEQKQKVNLLLEELKTSQEIYRQKQLEKQNLTEQIALQKNLTSRNYWDLARDSVEGNEDLARINGRQFAIADKNAIAQARELVGGIIDTNTGSKVEAVSGVRTDYVLSSEDEIKMLQLKEQQLNKVRELAEAHKRVENISQSSLTTEEKKLAIQKVEAEFAEKGVKLDIDHRHNAKNQTKDIEKQLNTQKNIAKHLLSQTDEIETQVGFGRKNAAINADIASSSKQIENTQKRIRDILGSIGKGFSSFGNVMSSVASTGMSAAMAVNTLTGAFTSLSDAEAGWGQIATNFFMGITMMIPAISSGLKLIQDYMASLSLQQGATIAAQKLSQAETMKEITAKMALAEITDKTTDEEIEGILATILAQKLEISSVAANATAKELLNQVKKKSGVNSTKEAFDTLMSKKAIDAETASIIKNKVAKTLTNPVTLLAAAGAVILAGSIMAIVKASAENIKMREEEAKAQSEKLQELKEEKEAQEELIKSYNDAKKAYQEQIEAGEDASSQKETLGEAAEALAKKYDIEIKAVERLTGNYTDLEAEIKKVNKARNQELKDQAEDTKKANLETLRDKARAKGRGHVIGSTFSVDLAGYEPFEQEVLDVIQEIIDEKNLKDFKIVGDNLEFPDEEEQYYYYGELVKEAISRLRKKEGFETEHSRGFETLKDVSERMELEATDGAFAAVTSADEEIKIGALNSTYSELLEKSYGGAIKSEEEYLKFEKDFINKMKENYGDLIEEEKDYRDFLSDLTPYSNIVAAKEELLEGRTGNDAEFMQKLIDEFGVEAVASIPTIPELDEKSLDKVIEIIEGRQAVINVTTERAGLDILKEGFEMDTSDPEAMKAWLNENIFKQENWNKINTIPGLMDLIEDEGYSKNKEGFLDWYSSLLQNEEKKENFIKDAYSGYLVRAKDAYSDEAESQLSNAKLSMEERNRIAVAVYSQSGKKNLEDNTEKRVRNTTTEEAKLKVTPVFKVDDKVDPSTNYLMTRLYGFQIGNQFYTQNSKFPPGLSWEDLIKSYKGSLQFAENSQASGATYTIPSDSTGYNRGTFIIDKEEIDAVSQEKASEVFGISKTVEELKEFMGEGLTVDEFIAKTKQFTSQILSTENALNNIALSDKFISENITTSEEDEVLEPLELDDQIERYHELNEQVALLDEQYQNLDEETDKLYGQDKLDKIDEQINHIKEKTIPTLQDLQKDIDTSLAQDTADLISEGFTIGENDLVTNATSRIKELTDIVNAATTEASREAAQKNLDNAKKALSQYEETLKLSRENTKEIEKQRELIEELEFEAFEYKFEIEFEKIEKATSEFEHYINLLNDTVYSTSEKIYFNAKNFDLMFKEYVEAVKQLEEYDGSDPDKQQQYQEKVWQAEKEINKARKQTYEDLKSFFEASGAEIDGLIDQFEKQNSFLEHYNNLAGLFGDGKNYRLNEKILKSQEENLDYQYKTAQEKTNFYEKQIRNLKKQYQEETDTEEKERLKQTLDELQKMRDEAYDAELSTLEEKLEKAKEIVELALEEAKDTFGKSLSGGIGLETLIENIEQDAEVAEHYLTDTNKMYETSKLEREAQLAIDKTDNLLAKQRLKAYQDEIRALQSKTDVSEFELTVAKERFEVLKAQIALEEAQANKSQMRLMRNAAGGYSYVYTADETNIAEAQQQLDDVQNKSYNTIRKQTKDSYNNYIKTMSEAEKALDELYQSRLNNEITNEEYQRQYEQLTQYYYERLLQHERDFTQARALLGEDRYQKELGYLNDSLINVENWSEKQKEYNNNVTESLENYEEQIEETIGESDGEFGLYGLQGAIDDVNYSSDKLYKTLTSDLIPSLDDETRAVKEAISAYREYNAQKSYLGTAYNSNDDYSSKMLNKNISKDELNYWANYRQIKEDSLDSLTGIVPTEKLKKFMIKVLDGDKNALELYDKIKAAPYITEELYDKLMKYDTGGYTGSWGAGGRLAMLHEKELVLNKQDTQNVLDAVQILRDMSSALGNEIRANALAVAASIGARGWSSKFDSSEKIVQQVVSIEASFPGVQTAYEIETALQSLVNDAAQAVSIKKD